MTRIHCISFTLIITLVIWAGCPLAGQDQSTSGITLTDIYRAGKFTPTELTGLNSMNDGEHFSVLIRNRIVKFSYETLDWVDILFDGSNFGDLGPIHAYYFNASEDKILIETGKEKIYRHSYLASYYVYDMIADTLYPLSAGGKQQLGTFSPSGEHVAFVRDNNLFIRDLKMTEESQITFDGMKNEIINGAPDWVYEEEFAFSKGFCWSPDGRKVAFYRFDESRVKQFHMTLFGPLYPESYEFKYPKAGEENSVVSIHVYDLDSGNTRPMDTGAEADQYLPRIKWTKDPNTLSIIRLNRRQNQLDILHANASTGESSVVYQEENRWFISEVSDNTVTYMEDGEQFILISEKAGYFHFYLYNFITGEMRPVTSGDFDIHEFIGMDEVNGVLYYTSYEESTTERHLCSIRLDGSRKKKLSTRPGTNSAVFSRTYDYYILEHSSINSPASFTLFSRKGKEIRVLADNALVKKNMADYGFAPVEFLTVPTESGLELNAWMIKPVDFDAAKEYPLFVFVYGGPESQKVIDEWYSRIPWFQMLVQHGYIVACVDNRGTNGRGEAFRKSTYMNLGKLETIDQLEAAGWFGSQEYIDKDRMGIFGWSYGGFMTSLCMTRGKGTFKMGIAGAPVSNWRYYDTVYTERFMRTPQENPEGYDLNSPIHFAGSLEGKFLLIHGTGDDNVHFQNSMDFVEALVQSGKQFNMQFYPNEPHTFRNPNGVFHLYTTMTEFILENL